MKIKSGGYNKASIENAHKELEKTKKQINSMKNLQSTLYNQLKDLENKSE